jgi:ribosomal protein L11 methyltransferase
MKNLYCFYIHPHVPLDIAWEELEAAGIEIAYGSEENEIKELYGYLEEGSSIPNLKSITSFNLTVLPAIDWEAQWANHGWNFYEGKIHLDLNQFSSKEGILLLQPGPGFGDLSHPTTRLVLRLMEKFISNTLVIDIGCGSGILTLAAIGMGASFAYGVDIDSQALEHALLNVRLNHLENKCQFCLPSALSLQPIQEPVLMLMNMILTEQQEAWKSLPILHPISGKWITSGIREEEKEEYLRQTTAWNWQLLEEAKEEEWIGFIFKSN